MFLLSLLLTRSFHTAASELLGESKYSNYQFQGLSVEILSHWLDALELPFFSTLRMILLQAACKLHFETQMESCVCLAQVAGVFVPGRCLCPTPP